MTTAKNILEHAAAMMRLEVLAPKRNSEVFEASGQHRRTQYARASEERELERDREIAVTASERRERDRRILEDERARRFTPAPAAADPNAPPILTEAEIEEMRRTTPRPAPRAQATDADVASAIEKCWKTRFGEPTPYANVTLSKMRGGGR